MSHLFILFFIYCQNVIFYFFKKKNNNNSDKQKVDNFLDFNKPSWLIVSANYLGIYKEGYEGVKC